MGIVLLDTLLDIFCQSVTKINYIICDFCSLSAFFHFINDKCRTQLALHCPKPRPKFNGTSLPAVYLSKHLGSGTTQVALYLRKGILRLCYLAPHGQRSSIQRSVQLSHLSLLAATRAPQRKYCKKLQRNRNSWSPGINTQINCCYAPSPEYLVSPVSCCSWLLWITYHKNIEK
jgi:hypothetical protein